MGIRTDLALERQELNPDSCDQVEKEELSMNATAITRIRITGEKGAQQVGKPIGTYVTIEVPPFSHQSAADDTRRSAISVELNRLLPKEGTVLIAGLGNNDITPDALGPKVAEGILATRHIDGRLSHSLGLGELRPVCVISPGVLGKTGMESAEMIKGVVDKIHPCAVIVIDALASRRLSRLGRTVQLCDTGISPGSGVGNTRKEISPATLGVPVVAIGVPTVVDATTLAHDLLGEEGDFGQDMTGNGESMMVTPREIDTVISHAADLIALSINCALHPHLSPEVLTALV